MSEVSCPAYNMDVLEWMMRLYPSKNNIVSNIHHGTTSSEMICKIKLFSLISLPWSVMFEGDKKAGIHESRNKCCKNQPRLSRISFRDQRTEKQNITQNHHQWPLPKGNVLRKHFMQREENWGRGGNISIWISEFFLFSFRTPSSWWCYCWKGPCEKSEAVNGAASRSSDFKQIIIISHVSTTMIQSAARPVLTDKSVTLYK